MRLVLSALVIIGHTSVSSVQQKDRALFLPLPPLKEVMEGWALSPEPVTLSDVYL